MFTPTASNRGQSKPVKCSNFSVIHEKLWLRSGVPEKLTIHREEELLLKTRVISIFAASAQHSSELGLGAGLGLTEL